MKALWFVILLGLCGCARFRPDLPPTPIPASWQEVRVRGSEVASIDPKFWQALGDPVLDRLEEEAIAANHDLEAALHRIEQARALTSEEKSRRLPHADASAYFFKDETLLNPSSYGSKRHNLTRVAQEQYNLLTDLSYEVDLWGKLRGKERAARLRSRAVEWEYQFVYQTLVSEVAFNYLALRSLQQEEALLMQATSARQDRVALYQARAQAGLEAELDLSRAILELTLTERDLEETRRRLVMRKNSLASLLGKPPSMFDLPTGSLPSQQVELPALLPSEVLMRRPDVQQAWMETAAAQTEVNVAIKDFFPSFNLTTALGLSTPLLSHFFEWQARYWQYALSIVAPLWDGGARKARVRKAKGAFYEKFALYQKSVNQAFQDVEDALSTVASLRQQHTTQVKAVEAAQDTAQLAQSQFQAGVISYLLVADTEHTLLQQQQKEVSLRGEQLIAWVRLMKALGIA